MAEAVHQTDTASSKPSLFELMAADGLFSSLHPAVRHACKIIAARYPSTQTWLERHFDELFLVVNALFQRHYLFTYAGSLAENFYGIKRTPVSGGDGRAGLRLLPGEVYRSLVWLCAFPYVKAKLDALFEELEHQEASGVRPEQEWRRRARQLMLRLYPPVHATFSTAVAFCYLAYMFDKCGYHSPLSWLSGVRLETVTADDWRLARERDDKLSSWTRLRSRGLPAALTLYGLHATTRLASHALQVGSFLVQFLQWWSGAGDRDGRRLGAVDVAPPDRRPLAQGEPEADGRCPLCGRTRTNEAVLAVSGYVFCHPCIFRHVSEKGRCPISWYPASTEQIYRLSGPGDD
ncbi:Peroxisome assembly protein 12 [Amphibalanus amphitrite]|uniref:Peroxisome assembly protein 12 n=1 Tax=Amphibalanus amphitrite TaxID=1232801 RepID=A0A6A4VQ53_AMPAM|nr:Peroxisome assembly protein 12 [Amphibalanus amphitrite]KAF0292823.1 Peroxisome assembly protein 12 [Amphibalanus amphitrite]